MESPATAFEAPALVRDIRDTTLVKDGDLFLLADLAGDVPAGNTDGLGLYYRDTRFLSTYDMAVQGLAPTILLSSGRWHSLGTYVLTNQGLLSSEGVPVDKETLQIRRYRVLRGRRVTESITFQNFNAFPFAVEVALHVGADFADMFDVRGVTRTPARMVRRESLADGVLFAHTGLDGVARSTRILFVPAPARCEVGMARYRFELAARGSARISIDIDVAEEDPSPARLPASRDRGREPPGPSVRTSSDRFDAVLTQAGSDLRALQSGEGEDWFLSAGIPWYAALFGRDSVLTALADLWLCPSTAAHVLTLLARAQGLRDDPLRDEEPGKILHEHRRGELARAGVVPFGPYYGTVDATPLWILLLGAHHRATGDLELVRRLAPHLDAALLWIDRHGDLDGDGFVEYRRRSPDGLVNQGWKDSCDAVVHVDGSLAEPPIALVEVQAYVHAAKRAAATLYRALGDPARAGALRAEAARLKRAFDEAFWMPAEGYYALALDGPKRRVSAIASNAGHALFCGIVPPERAPLLAERLLGEDLFSGWGIRTLSCRELRYNPAGYHLGTVWPHDNALIALGLKRYGLDAHVVAIATGLFDAVQHFPSLRLPELFCGFARSAFGVPVRYPVACCPQAWATTVWSALLQALLGIVPDAAARELVLVRPTLPPWLSWVEIDRLRIGDAEVDVRFERIGERTAVDVAAMRGDVRVTLADRWPERDEGEGGG